MLTWLGQLSWSCNLFSMKTEPEITPAASVGLSETKTKIPMSAFTTSLFILGCVFGGALLGIAGHSLLPADHLSSDTKGAVQLAMGLVATTVALVLGLLIASAKGFYDSQNTEVTQAAAHVVLLDRILAHYGPEAEGVRVVLRSFMTRWVDLTWQRNDSARARFEPTTLGSEVLLDKIQELSPHNDMQRSLQSQALSSLFRLSETKWLLYTQKTSSVPTPMLAMLIFWLTLLFTSFGLFVRPNATVVVSLFASALAVCGAIFLILDMYQPYGGFIRVSDAPMRAALAQLGQ
jgi:hypothetical protein